MRIGAALEPRSLYKLWLTGTILGLGGFLSAVGIEIARGQAGLEENVGYLCCAEQLEKREEKLRAIKKALKVVNDRKNYFEVAIKNSSHPAYIYARTGLDSERLMASRLMEQKKGLDLQPMVSTLGFEIAALVISLALTGCLVAVMWASRDSVSSFESVSLSAWDKKWIFPFAVFVAVIFGAHFIEKLFTSVLALEKSWYHWNSFCVSPSSFVAVRVAILGTHIAASAPLTLFYCLTRKDSVPKIDLDDRSGRSGVGKYIDFLQRWCFVGIIIGALVFIAFVQAAQRSQAKLDFAYLLTPGVIFGVVAFLVARTIRNGYVVRRRYEKRVKALGDTWSEIQTKKFPVDPTLTFLGREWWKLPAVVSAALGISLAVAMWLRTQPFGD